MPNACQISSLNPPPITLSQLPFTHYPYPFPITLSQLPYYPLPIPLPYTLVLCMLYTVYWVYTLVPCILGIYPSTLYTGPSIFVPCTLYTVPYILYTLCNCILLFIFNRSHGCQGTALKRNVDKSCGCFLSLWDVKPKQVKLHAVDNPCAYVT